MTLAGAASEHQTNLFRMFMKFNVWKKILTDTGRKWNSIINQNILFVWRRIEQMQNKTMDSLLFLTVFTSKKQNGKPRSHTHTDTQAFHLLRQLFSIPAYPGNQKTKGGCLPDSCLYSGYKACLPFSCQGSPCSLPPASPPHNLNVA